VAQHPLFLDEGDDLIEAVAGFQIGEHERTFAPRARTPARSPNGLQRRRD
jgi:hypothetical protein